MRFANKVSLGNDARADKHRGREFLCETCREHGYGLKELETFQCTRPGCKFTGGRGKFQQAHFRRDYEKGQVLCINCATEKKGKKRKLDPSGKENANPVEPR